MRAATNAGRLVALCGPHPRARGRHLGSSVPGCRAHRSMSHSRCWSQDNPGHRHGRTMGPQATVGEPNTWRSVAASSSGERTSHRVTEPEGFTQGVPHTGPPSHYVGRAPEGWSPCRSAPVRLRSRHVGEREGTVDLLGDVERPPPTSGRQVREAVVRAGAQASTKDHRDATRPGLHLGRLRRRARWTVRSPAPGYPEGLRRLAAQAVVVAVEVVGVGRLDAEAAFGHVGAIQVGRR